MNFELRTLSNDSIFVVPLLASYIPLFKQLVKLKPEEREEFKIFKLDLFPNIDLSEVLLKVQRKADVQENSSLAAYELLETSKSYTYNCNVILDEFGYPYEFEREEQMTVVHYQRED